MTFSKNEFSVSRLTIFIKKRLGAGGTYKINFWFPIDTILFLIILKSNARYFGELESVKKKESELLKELGVKSLSWEKKFTS